MQPGAPGRRENSHRWSTAAQGAQGINSVKNTSSNACSTNSKSSNSVEPPGTSNLTVPYAFSTATRPPPVGTRPLTAQNIHDATVNTPFGRNSAAEPSVGTSTAGSPNVGAPFNPNQTNTLHNTSNFGNNTSRKHPGYFSNRQASKVVSQQMQIQSQKQPQPQYHPAEGFKNENHLNSTTASGHWMNDNSNLPLTPSTAHSGNGMGTFFSGTKTAFTEMGTGVYSAAVSVNDPLGGSPTLPARALGVLGDLDDDELNQLFREFEYCVDSSSSEAVMRDVVFAIEKRSVAYFDPHSRDLFLEQRIKDLLTPLVISNKPHSLFLAVKFVDALLPIAYTCPTQKFIRLSRSLLAVMQSGFESPAKAAQVVFKRLLEFDLTFPASEAPLRMFIPKELVDNFEQGFLQTYNSRGATPLQSTRISFHARFFATMLACKVTAQVNPRYLPFSARQSAIQLATILVGYPDEVLNKAAYECLLAIFSDTSVLQPNQILIEARRVVEEAIRSLRTASGCESAILSSLRVLRALASSRGLACVDKQTITHLHQVVSEQSRVAKSAVLRSAICELVPIIAKTDIASSPHHAAYCAIIMEPVKNVRNEKDKARELECVSAFIDSVGYNILDISNRLNLNSILHRYIELPETLEQCWGILAAMCRSHIREAAAMKNAHQSSKEARSFTTSTGNVYRPSSRGSAGPAPPTSQFPLSTKSLPDARVVNPSHSQTDSFHFGSIDTGNCNSKSPELNMPLSPDAIGGTSTTGSLTLNTGQNHIGALKATVSEDSVETGKSLTIGSSKTSPSTSPTAAGPTMDVAAGLNNITELVRASLASLEKATLSERLIAYLSIVREAIPSLSSAIQNSIDSLVDSALAESMSLTQNRGLSVENFAMLSDSASGSSGINIALPSTSFGNNSINSAKGITPVSQNSQPPRKMSLGLANNPVMGRFVQYFAAPSASSTDNYASASQKNNDVPNSGAFNDLSSSMASGLIIPNDSTFPAASAEDFKAVAQSSFAKGGSAPCEGSISLVGAPFNKQGDLRVALKEFSKRPVTSVQELEKIKNTIMPYQRSSDPEVRRQSSTCIITCLSNWVRYACENKTSTYSTRVTEILEAYVKGILLETDPRYRLHGIKLLYESQNLRLFLSEQQTLTSLLSFLSDTASVREKTVDLLIAITQDPKPSPSVASVSQSLYIIIESCTVVLEYASDVRIIIRSMADLQLFTRPTVKLLVNHLGRIFYACKKRLQEEGLADVVILSIVKTVDAILSSLVKDEELSLCHQDDVTELYKCIVAILKSSSSPSVSHTAINVLVYMQKMGAYPQSLETADLHDLILTISNVYTGTSSTQAELCNILTLFGQIGAVDPSTKATRDSAKTKKDDEGGVLNEADMELTYDYTVIVYRTLSRMLDLSLSETVCIQAMRTLLLFVRHTTDKKDTVGGAHAVRAIMQIAKRATDSAPLRNEALHILAAIASLRYEKISKTLLPEIVVLLEQLWMPSDHALFRAVLEVVGALKPGKISGKEQAESWAWLYPRLIDVALKDRTESKEFSLKVVEIILNASHIPPHCIPLVFPMLMRFVQQFDLLVEVRSQSLCAAVHIVCELKSVQHFNALMRSIQTLTRHCRLNDDLGPRLSNPSVCESLRVLSALHPSGRAAIMALKECLIDFDDGKTQPYGVAVVGDTLGQGHSGSVTGTGSGSVSGAGVVTGGGGGANVSTGNGGTGNVLMPISGASYSSRSKGSIFASQGKDEDGQAFPTESSEQELANFMRHVESGLRLKTGKWKEWFVEFQKGIIAVSPHPAFRILMDLFDKHEALRRELFHPSFKCLYEALNAEQIKKVNEALTNALNGPDNEVVSKCLGLADYLDHNEPNIKEEVRQKLRDIEIVSGRSSDETGNKVIFTSGDANAAVAAISGVEGAVTTLSAVPRNSCFTIGSAQQSENAFDFDSGSLSLTNEAKNNFSTINSSKEDDMHHESNAVARDSGVKKINVPNTTDNFVNLEGFEPLARPLNPAKGGRGSRLSHTAAGKGNIYSDSSTHSTPYPESVSLNHNALFSVENLVNAAERTHMYDKALSYLESKLLVSLQQYKYSKLPRSAIQNVVRPLAWLYSKREMQDSVVGLFNAIRYKGESDDGFGFELLRWWEEAQRVYAQMIKASIGTVPSPQVLEGYVRTLCFCAEWEKALDVAKATCIRSSIPSSTIAHSGAMSAWILGKWDDVKLLTNHIVADEKSNAPMQYFYLNSVYLKNVLDSKEAGSNLKQSLVKAKLSVNESLRTLLPLSYAHAYDNLTMIQHFTEMEELLHYRSVRSEVVRQKMVRRWHSRFMLLNPDSLMPSLRSLMLHSLILNTNEMSDMILHFCEVMGTHYPQLTQWAMNWLDQGSFPPSPASHNRSYNSNSHPNVSVGYINHVWSKGKRDEAIRLMETFLTNSAPNLEENYPTCYGNAQLRLGTWKQELHNDSFWKRDHRKEQLGHFHKAIRAMPLSYEAWHSWALMNYRVQQRDHDLTPEEQRSFVESAHQGFVAAICRCRNASSALPGIMRLIQLWVIHDGVSLLKETVADSISRIPIDSWVQAIPQLIGHLSSTSHDVREVVSMILKALCEAHPQAVVFPLLVVIMSNDGDSNDQAQVRKINLVHSIIQRCPKRIQNDAENVAKLLVDVAAIPIEKIRENLSAVATAWNPNAEYEEDPDEVKRRLRATLELFIANRKHLLYTVGDIGQYVQLVMDEDARGYREKASGIVSQLVDEISKHVAEKLGREPQKAMEPLLQLRNLSIAVFGEYDFQSPSFPTIAAFSRNLDVIPSKKRPRRVRLNGSNGCLYSYCLKGNEDIRMDERVMQLFGMVNVLLSHSRTPSSSFIHRFPVIPISSTIGLLGWVENANTINNTICNYRNSVSRIRTNQESITLRSYVDSFGQWDKLSIIQRTEALDYVMDSENCNAVDVSRSIWHRSNTAEQWLDRRTTFTQSLATMSLVGYILGLGDRHLGNILLCMSTGKIVHIDFGDSFDVGRLRHVLPETVPFRLTRMLTNAMEVFGVDGVFRASCTATQHTLHGNRDSIMALLSAFVYDPIVQHKGRMKSMLEKSRSPQDVAERIRNKLRGTEMAVERSKMTIFNTTNDSSRRPDLLFMSQAFDDAAQRLQSLAFSTPQQVSFLINEATRIDNFSTVYFGWGPLW